MLRSEFNPFGRTLMAMVALALLAFLRLFRRWLLWPQAPEEALTRSWRVVLFGGNVFAAALTGILCVNKWLVDLPAWRTWTGDSEAMLPVGMFILFLLSLVLYAWGTEHALRNLHAPYRAHVDEQRAWHPRPGRD